MKVFSFELRNNIFEWSLLLIVYDVIFLRQTIICFLTLKGYNRRKKMYIGVVVNEGSE